jgi:hypothetical protein
MCSRTLVYAYFTVVSIASYQIPFRDKWRTWYIFTV